MKRSRPLREVSGERDPVLSALLEQLRAELLTRSRSSQLFVQGIAQSLSVYLVRGYSAACPGERRGRGGLPAFHLRKITALLETRLTEGISLGQLADQAGYSACHLSRLFRRTTGVSLSSYLIRLRMDRARLLLRQTPKSIIEIGWEVGYTSPSHFAQIFRREVGITPSEYRGSR